MHTGVYYVGGEAHPSSFCTISASRLKGPPALWQHLEPILHKIKRDFSDIKAVHFFSDGPCTQYKQPGNFYLFCTEIFKMGFTWGSWNFFEASHGKGAPDGIGGTLKRMADRLVSQGNDTPTALSIYQALDARELKYQLFYIPEHNVDNAVKEMPSGLLSVPSTMRIHQVLMSILPCVPCLGEVFSNNVYELNISLMFSLPGDYSFTLENPRPGRQLHVFCNRTSWVWLPKKQQASALPLLMTTEKTPAHTTSKRMCSGTLQMLWGNGVPYCMTVLSIQGSFKKWIRPTGLWNACTGLGQIAFSAHTGRIFIGIRLRMWWQSFPLCKMLQRATWPLTKMYGILWSCTKSTLDCFKWQYFRLTFICCWVSIVT